MNVYDPQTYQVSVDEIVPNLYVGNQAAASNPSVIKQLGITLIINATTHIPNYHKGIKYYRVPVNDPGEPIDLVTLTDLKGRIIRGPSVEMKANKLKQTIELDKMRYHIKAVVRMIRTELLNGGHVLVHCHAGIQRSATIVTAYLMKYHSPSNWGHLSKYLYARKCIQEARPVVFYGGHCANFEDVLLQTGLFT